MDSIRALMLLLYCSSCSGFVLTCLVQSEPSSNPVDDSRTLYALQSAKITSAHSRDVVRHLLNGYDYAVRPVLDESKPIAVQHEIVPFRIVYVNELNQEVKMNMWIRQVWTDEFLIWNPEDFNGTDHIYVFRDRIWRPDLVLYENNAVNPTNSGQDDIPVMVKHDGTVINLSPWIYIFSCKLNLYNYPFDVQVCDMKFSSWAYDGHMLNLTLRAFKGESTSYASNGEWDLLTVRVKRNVVYYPCCPEPYPDVTYTIVLKRRSYFYVLTIIFPFIFLSLLSNAVFFMPPDTGEKMNLAVTSLLSLIVFNQLVINTIPPTSDGTFPVIAIYFVVSVFIVLLSVLVSVLVLHVHHKQHSGLPVPPITRFLIFRIFGIVSGMYNYSSKLEERRGLILDSIRKIDRSKIRPERNGDANHARFRKRSDSFHVISRKFREEDFTFSSYVNEYLEHNEEIEPTGPMDCAVNEGYVPEVNANRLEMRTRSVSQTREMLSKILDHADREAKAKVKKEFQHEIAMEWVEASKILDRAFFVIFLTISVVSPIVFIILATGMNRLNPLEE